MSYSSARKPRIYVNWAEWLYNKKGFTGISYINYDGGSSLKFPFTQDSFIKKSNPASQLNYGGEGLSFIFGTNTINFWNKINFFMLVDHNFEDRYRFRLQGSIQVYLMVRILVIRISYH